MGTPADAAAPAGVSSPFAEAVSAVRRGVATAEQAATTLTAALTDDELLWLLDGDLQVLPGLRQMATGYGREPFIAGSIERLGIPGVRLTDGPRGVAAGTSTSFPVPIARAAAWDTGLERRVGAAIGSEAWAQGATLVAAPCINLAPAPGWGRSQESYGEDPVLIGQLGAALVEGLLPSVIPCVKHYALNSMEEARFRVDVQVAEADLHEVYLPHFRTVVEAGAGAVMTSYNRVNGTWAGESPYLITTVLRQMWQFRGLVLTDFIWGLRDPVGSLLAGQDIEMPFRQQRAAALPAALATRPEVRGAARAAAGRILATEIALAARRGAPPGPAVIASPEHQALAREVAARGMVLLRNITVADRPVLPLDLPEGAALAVVGRLAGEANLGDVASSQVRPPVTVSVLDGLRERLGDGVRGGPELAPAAAAELAAACAAAIVVVGLTPAEEGEHLAALDREAIAALGGIARFRVGGWLIGMALRMAARRAVRGGDRRDLHLRPQDVALIEAVAAVQPRTTVVVIGGGTIMVDPWDERVGALLLAWYPGMAGGHAVADVLLGQAEPTGRLPFAIPRRRADLPTLDWSADAVTYPRWWGQRLLDRTATPAAYPFGFGLGYGTVTLGALTVTGSGPATLTATVPVSAHGERPTRPVVGAYLTSDDDPTWQLGGFTAGEPLAPGEAGTLTVEVSLRPLERWRDGRWLPAPDRLRVHAARWANDPEAVSVDVTTAGPPSEQ